MVYTIGSDSKLFSVEMLNSTKKGLRIASDNVPQGGYQSLPPMAVGGVGKARRRRTLDVLTVQSGEPAREV